MASQSLSMYRYCSFVCLPALTSTVPLSLLVCPLLSVTVSLKLYLPSTRFPRNSTAWWSELFRTSCRDEKRPVIRVSRHLCQQKAAWPGGCLLWSCSYKFEVSWSVKYRNHSISSLTSLLSDASTFASQIFQFFTANSQVRCYNTRHTDKFPPHLCHTTHTEFSLTYRGSLLWTSHP